jgi:hypothetical protein
MTCNHFLTEEDREKLSEFQTDGNSLTQRDVETLWRVNQRILSSVAPGSFINTGYHPKVKHANSPTHDRMLQVGRRRVLDCYLLMMRHPAMISCSACFCWVKPAMM